MTFSERLKTLREEKGFTQQQLADVLHISIATVSHYEKGSREPSIGTLVQIADIFNVSVDYLVGSTDINIIPEEMKKIYCKGISTGNLLRRAIPLDTNHRQYLNYMLRCLELEQLISNKGKQT